MTSRSGITPGTQIASTDTERISLPVWAQLADGLTIVVLICAALIAWTGGLRSTIGDVRVSATSPWRALVVALAIFMARHLVVRRRTLPRRLFDLARRLNTGFAGSARARTIATLRAGPWLAAIALFLCAVGRYYEPGLGFTRMISFGDRFADRALPAVAASDHFVFPESYGYDGQWYAQLATCLCSCSETSPYCKVRICSGCRGCGRTYDDSRRRKVASQLL